jgi:hypothetical protein
MLSTIAIASITAVYAVVIAINSWVAYKFWRSSRPKKDDREKRLREQCTPQDICIECGECWHKHIYEPWKFSHTFINKRT